MFEDSCKCSVDKITNWERSFIQMNLLIKNEYKYNSNFKKYVDEYCTKNGCTPEDAFKDEQVKRIFWRYTEVQMTSYINKLYMEQIINESGIKSNVCSKYDCSICNNLVKCYMDVSKQNDDKDLNYGGYETETHY